MKITRPIQAALRCAVAPGLVVLLLATAGCSSNTVTPPPPTTPLSRVDLVPAGDSLSVGGTRVFVATAYDTADVAVPGIAFTWTTSSTSVATVTSQGLVTARGEGLALVIAAASGKADTAIVYVFGQNSGWNTQTSGTARNLNAVFFLPNGRTGWAVGALGTLVVTTDAGATWTPKTSGTTSDLQSVWFSSPSVGWIAGDAGVLLKTTDGGSTWARDLTVGLSQNLMCVRFVDANHGWLVGAGGAIVRTNNGGASWTRRYPTTATLKGVAFADTLNGWAVGTSGIILGSHDGGVSWYLVQPSVTGLALEAVERRSNTVAWAVGASGTLLNTSATTDSLEWNTGSLGAANGLRGLMFVDNSVAYAVGVNGGGVVFKTLDGGSNWVQQQANSSQPLNDVFFVDKLRGWAVGDGGRIVHTSRGGNL